jgi:hypothetical protein
MTLPYDSTRLYARLSSVPSSWPSPAVEWTSPASSPSISALSPTTASYEESADITTFTCPHDGCALRLASQPALNVHIKKHTRPFKCEDESCEYSYKGFAAKKELDKHRDSKHRLPSSSGYLCPVSKCKYSRCLTPKTRRDNFLRHIKRRHQDLYDWAKDNIHQLEYAPDRSRVAYQ